MHGGLPPRRLAAVAVALVAAITLAAFHGAHAARTDGPALVQPPGEDLLGDVALAAGLQPDLAYGMNGLQGHEIEARSDADLAYGQVWIGRWLDKPGGEEKYRKQVEAARANGLTPVVEWWYFGDAISKKAVTKGLPDGRNVERWHELAPTVARVACEGGPAVIVVETEFNKGGVGRHEPFDGELAKHIRLLKDACPEATVVLGFGGWGAADWHRFDRAAAAADGVGLQLMRSLSKDSILEYEHGPADTVSGARRLHDLFGKPVYIHDVALSSWGPGGKRLQAETLDELLDRRGDLKDAGVVLLLYRSVRDAPHMAKNNYYAHGEAHWGLLTRDGKEKPAFRVWTTAIAA